MANDIKPFKIAVPDAAIDSLKSKLADASFADPVEFSDDWNYGSPLTDVQRLAKRWHNGFDWRKQEAKLNELPQFTTPIPVDGFDTLNIHFVHQKSAKPGSIPLLFVHGCQLYFPCYLARACLTDVPFIQGPEAFTRSSSSCHCSRHQRRASPHFTS